MCVYVYIYIYIHNYIYDYNFNYIYIYIHICIYIYIYMYTHIIGFEDSRTRNHEETPSWFCEDAILYYAMLCYDIIRYNVLLLYIRYNMFILYVLEHGGCLVVV